MPQCIANFWQNAIAEMNIDLLISYNLMKNIIDIFLDELGIRHTYSHVHDLYEKHPYKNNLYGLSLMLTEYSVKTQGVKISSKDLDA